MTKNEARHTVQWQQVEMSERVSRNSERSAYICACRWPTHKRQWERQDRHCRTFESNTDRGAYIYLQRMFRICFGLVCSRMRDVHRLLKRGIIDSGAYYCRGIGIGGGRGTEVGGGSRLADREKIDIRWARCERSFRLAHLLAQRVPDARNIN